MEGWAQAALYPGSRCAQDDAALCRRGPSVYSHPFEASGCSAAAREPDRAVLQLEAFADSELSGEPPGTSTARRAVLQFRAFAERSGKMSQTADTLPEALELATRAVSREDLICVTGSFYLVGETMKHLAKRQQQLVS